MIEEKRKEIIAAELAESKKNKELADNYKTRAEKAETENKKLKPVEKKEEKENENNYTLKDTLAIIDAKVHEDDIEEVAEYAAFKKISVGEALKSGVMKAHLAEKAENRRTVAATQTRQTRQTTKTDATTIVDNIRNKGEEGVPNAGSSEAEELFWSRRGGRR